MDRIQGQTAHPPLTELGRSQAASVAETLTTRGVTRVISSPAVRAQQTADIIAQRLGLSVEIDPLLTEQDLDEPITDVLGRIQKFLAGDLEGTVVAVSHGDTIGLSVGMLAGQKPVLPDNCSITSVDPQTRTVDVTLLSD